MESHPQDKAGDGRIDETLFDEHQSFCGNLTEVGIWAKVLQSNEIRILSECDSAGSSIIDKSDQKVVQWSENLDGRWRTEGVEAKMVLIDVDSICQLNTVPSRYLFQTSRVR